MAQVQQADLGTDIKIGKVLTFESGYQNLVTQLIRRLSTRRGALFYDPNYGDDIRLFMNRPITQTTLNQIAFTVKSQCELDPRVKDADVEVSYTQATISFSIKISITTFQGPFTFVLSVTALDVNLLKIQ